MQGTVPYAHLGIVSDPSKRLKNLIFLVSGMVIIFMLCFWVIYWRGSQDIEPPDVSDLVVKAVTVAPEDNALTYVEKATNALIWDRSLVWNEDPEAVDLESWIKGEVEIDAAVLAKTMKENHTVFEELKRASECPLFVAPRVLLDQPSGWDISGFIALRGLVAAKARCQAESGDIEAAVETLIANYRLALLIQGDGANLFHLLVSNAMTHAFTEEMIVLARRVETPKAVIEKMLETIPQSSTVDQVFSRAMKNEYFGISEYIDHCLSSEEGRDNLVHMSAILDLPDQLEFLSGAFFTYRFHPNRTKQLFADNYRNYIFKRPDTYVEAANSGFLEYEGGEFCWQEALKPNALGMSLALDSETSIFAYAPFLFEKLCTMKHQLDSSRLALAALAYQKDHGSLPPSLKELEGRYLSEIPNDPFDGSEMRYSSSKHIIYSIGEDGLDDGGDRDDLAVKLLAEP